MADSCHPNYQGQIWVAEALLRETLKKFQRDEKLAMEFNTLHREDEHLPLEQRFGSSLVLAMRPWEPKIFADVRRKPNAKVFS